MDLPTFETVRHHDGSYEVRFHLPQCGYTQKEAASIVATLNALSDDSRKDLAQRVWKALNNTGLMSDALLATELVNALGYADPAANQ